MSLTSKLTGVVFYGFNKKLRWDKIFMWRQIQDETGRNVTKFPNNIFFRSLIRKRNVTLNVQHNPFIGYINSGRESCINAFDTFCGLGQFDKVYQSPKKYVFCNLDWFWLVFKYIPSWRETLKPINLTPSQKREIIVDLINFWYLQTSIGTLKFTKYRLFVAFFDANPESAFLREMFRVHQVPTATLQHGQFVGYREDVLENSGIEFRCFNSDHFLVWNKFTIDEAIKHGIDLERMTLCGILGYIGTKRKKCSAPQNNTFGVVLGHPVLGKEENLILIQAANILARERNLKYFLKLHPNYAENFFDNMADSKYYVGNIQKGIPMMEYASMVDFSIIGGSSVFVELIYMGHDTIRFSNNDVKDKFRDIKIGKIFHHPDEIVAVYDEHKGKDFTNELFDYLCSVDDVTAAYKKFLSKF